MKFGIHTMPLEITPNIFFLSALWSVIPMWWILTVVKWMILHHDTIAHDPSLQLMTLSLGMSSVNNYVNLIWCHLSVNGHYELFNITSIIRLIMLSLFCHLSVIVQIVLQSISGLATWHSVLICYAALVISEKNMRSVEGIGLSTLNNYLLHFMVYMSVTGLLLKIKTIHMWIHEKNYGRGLKGFLVLLFICLFWR
jgi:hypothetical protein